MRRLVWLTILVALIACGGQPAAKPSPSPSPTVLGQACADLVAKQASVTTPSVVEGAYACLDATYRASALPQFNDAASFAAFADAHPLILERACGLSFVPGLVMPNGPPPSGVFVYLARDSGGNASALLIEVDAQGKVADIAILNGMTACP